MKVNNKVKLNVVFQFQYGKKVYKTAQKINYDIKKGWKRAANTRGPFEEAPA